MQFILVGSPMAQKKKIPWLRIIAVMAVLGSMSILGFSVWLTMIKKPPVIPDENQRPSEVKPALKLKEDGITGVWDEEVVIQTSRDQHPISPLIYGVNTLEPLSSFYANMTAVGGGTGTGTATGTGTTVGVNKLSSFYSFVAIGSNRFSTYNWESNTSSGGLDFGNSIDTELLRFADGSVIENKAGSALRQRIQSAHSVSASALIHLPLFDQVAGPDGGSVKLSYQKPTQYEMIPNPNDGVVYEDEFLHWMSVQFPDAYTSKRRRVFYALDYEPDLWTTILPNWKKQKLTYAGYFDRFIEVARAVKAKAPDALIFGPSMAGWHGISRLADAPDQGGRDFMKHYLDAMRLAEKQHGKRLLDVVDVHWFPEPTLENIRIVGRDVSDLVAEKRIQAPRVLWDPEYVEHDWIAVDVGNRPLRLIPRLKGFIAEHYPGTEFSISSYNFGGAQHISGALAQADILGIFGREGVFAAGYKPAVGAPEEFIEGAFQIYRNYDGNGGRFGDVSVAAVSKSAEKLSAYASVSSQNPDLITIVVINKYNRELTTRVIISHNRALESAKVWRLTERSPKPEYTGQLIIQSSGAMMDTLPPRSITEYVISPLAIK